MGKAISQISGSNTTSSTVYMPISGSIGQGNHSSETQAQITCRSAGTFSDLQVNSTSGTPTVVFRKNLANANQTISASGQAHDSTHTDTVVAGDEVNLVLSSGSSIALQELSSYFAATTDTATRLNSTGDNSGISSSSQNYYFVPGGRCASGGTSTEVNAQVYQANAGTMQHLFCFLNNNSRSETDTINDRKNGANGSLTASIGSTTSGVFEDTTHSTTIVSGDKYCVDIVLGSSTSSMSLNEIGVDFIATSSATELVDGISNGLSMSSGSTYYWYLGGELQTNTSESSRQTAIQVAYTFQDLSINEIVNTSARTLVYRKGGANGNQTVTTGTSAGFYTDSTHTDTAVAGDLINYSLGSGSSSATVVAISMWGTTQVSTTRTVNETIALSESIKRKIVRKKTETISLAESVTKTRKVPRNISETLGLAETVTKTSFFLRKASETLSLAESASKLAKHFMTVSETLSLAETVLRRAIPKVTAESLSLSEVIRRTAIRRPGESLHLTESVSRLAKHLRIISESLGLAELIDTVLAASHLRSFSGTMALTENVIRKIKRLAVRRVTLA